jgi:predicted amidophosphoribosyltransferase
MVQYKSEEAFHPEDEKIKIVVYAPNWYKRGHGYDDLYSKKILNSKSRDEFDYFRPFVNELILQLFRERKIKIADTITIIPKSDGTFSPTLENFGLWTSKEFGGIFEKIFKKKPSARKNKGINNHDERFKKTKEEFSLIGGVKPQQKCIWILDDQKTTGSTLLVCTKLLKDSECKEVYCISLSINRDVGRFGE